MRIWSSWTRPTAAMVAMLLVVGLLGDAPALAEPESGSESPPPEVADVPVTEVEPAARPEWSAGHAVVRGEPRVAWPAAGTAEVALPPDSAAQAGVSRPDGAPRPNRGGRVAAGDLPVAVGAAPLTTDQAEDVIGGVGRAQAAVPGRVAVTVAGRDATRAAGIEGLLLEVARADGRRLPARVAVQVDYSGFRHAYGGDWATRLRLAVWPECGDGAGGAMAGVDCGPARVLATAHDAAAGMLVAEVPLAGDGTATTLSVSAGPAGDNGDYRATSLAPAATWQVSQQTGDFTWSYPLRVVPGLAGPEPELALSYSSGSIDGRTGNTNTQGSWVGDGWELWPGYIERSYRPCLDDTAAVDGRQPNNHDRETGDLCWVSDNATMSLNGQATELVRDSDGRYRAVADDGSRIEKLTDPQLGNGDHSGEYWRVTTTDGTQYFFGRHRRPAPAGAATTDSVWTAPVYGNHPGEPCHRQGDFSGSRCTRAWRWNLDYVVDPRGNSMTLFYARETGGYGRESEPAKHTAYHRGGYLRRIEYGTRSGTEHAGSAPARVVFDVADRCMPDTTCTSGNPSAWPDVPWDLYCAAAPCREQLAPTFWTQKRLAKVRAQVWRGADYATVDSWTLRQDFLEAGATDDEAVPMWLTGITRTGHVTTAGGDAVSEPEIVFDPGSDPLPNRVDGPADGRTALNRWRIESIFTETGGQIRISYSGPDCGRASLPTPHTNTKRCFPQWYAPGGLEPTLDWFHKYVVTAVDVFDHTGASEPTKTSYEYGDAPAWRYDDSELVDRDKRTWSQWRGYSKVRVYQGRSDTTQSRTDYVFLRGMHGDRESPSGGTRSVEVPDSQGRSVVDHEAHAGFLLEETLYNGGTWVSGDIHTPWRHLTASAGSLRSYLTGTATARTRTVLASGGTRWTRIDTTFDTTYGMPRQVDDRGDESTPDDDVCERYEYARNTSLWLVDLVRRTERLGVRCAAAQDPARPQDVLSGERTFYDDPDTFGATPVRGLPVRTEELGSWNGSVPVWVTTSRTRHDDHGRELEVRDALDRRTTTAYTPATGGPVTRTTATNPLGHTVTSVMEPAWQLPTRTTDANGHITDLAYDGLGRLTEVWLPGRAKGEHTGNLQFGYLLRTDRPTAVTTRKLLPSGDRYQVSVTLYDAQLRERQTQTQAPGGGRVLADKGFDTRGLVAWQSKDYYNSGAPSTTLVTTAGQVGVSGTKYVYDGAERVAEEIFHRASNGESVPAWRTTYTYGGDRVHMQPPAGGTATTTVTDARDRTVALLQYHGGSPSGTHDQTDYAYTKRDELASVTDPGENQWTFRYDLRGREVESVDPAKGRTVTSYDAEGQVQTVTDARGRTLAYTYDALGRRTSVRQDSPAGAKLAEWVFDTLPDGKGKLSRSIRYADGAAYVSELTGYDAAGRVQGTRVVIPTAEQGLAGTYETATTYHPDGSVWTTELPQLGDVSAERLTFGYNDIGAPTWLNSQYGQYVAGVVYNKLGLLTQRNLGGVGQRVALTYGYDEPTGRLLSTRVVPVNQPAIMDLAYSYDDAGNLLRVADSPTGSAPNDTQCYRYDYLRRLTEAWTPAATEEANCQPAPSAGLGGVAPYWLSWRYDPVGNRLSQVRHAATGDTTTTYTPDPALPHAVGRATVTGPDGSRLHTYGYDQAGNLTARALTDRNQQLAYDLEGNLASVTDAADTTSYVYDADGNRLIARDPAGSTLYLPDGQELRWDRATGTRTGTRYYTHADAVVAVRTGGSLTRLIGDHHGTSEAAVRAENLTQVARRRTTPFGEQRGAAPAFWPGDRGFVGGTEDPTGLTHLGAREYDPELGRFTTADPIVDFFDPQQMHGYAYGNNAPPTNTDPDGLFVKKLWNKGASAVSRVNNAAERIGGAVASGASKVGSATADFARQTVNDIKNDPWKFAAEVAVGVAAAAAIGAVCATGVGCVIAAGVVAGAAVAGAGYGMDVARGDREFSVKDAAVETTIGAWMGAATAGLGPLGKKAGNQFISKFTRSSGCGRNSFVPGTPVAMADGTHRPIEQVQAGERVLATDPETGQTTAEEVAATIVGEGEKTLVEITVADVGEPVVATHGHPIWVVNRGEDGEWVDAVDLRPGDRLLHPDGTEVPVRAVRVYAKRATVHNLTIANVHTYYVSAGDRDILTHNTNWSCNARYNPQTRQWRIEGERDPGDVRAVVEQLDEKPYAGLFRAGSQMIKGEGSCPAALIACAAGLGTYYAAQRAAAAWRAHRLALMGWAPMVAGAAGFGFAGAATVVTTQPGGRSGSKPKGSSGGPGTRIGDFYIT